MKRKNKKHIAKPLEIPKETNGGDFYNYEKMFIEIMDYLNKCKTPSDMEHLIKISEKFKQHGANKFLTDYVDDSIQNKIEALAIKENLNYTKLRTICDNH